MEEGAEEMSRLIDADKLLEELREYHPLSISYGILSDIEYFPTAYDAANVIEQLENVSFVDVDEEYADDGQRMLFLHDAIEIVKGGVEE